MTACFFCSVIPGFISLISAIEFLSFKSSIASDYLIHSTVMHVFLCCVSTGNLIGDGIHGAAKLIQLGKLALNLQFFLNALTGCRVEFLSPFNISDKFLCQLNIRRKSLRPKKSGGIARNQKSPPAFLAEMQVRKGNELKEK